MDLNDKIEFVGHFSITAYKKDGTVETYEDKNLIMDLARVNMAQLVGGVITGGAGVEGKSIDRFVLGTEGHVVGNILDYKKVGTNGFDSTRTNIFSEASGGEYYVIPFNNDGGTDTTTNPATCYNSKLPTTLETCTVRRTVQDRTVTYTITIPEVSGNSSAVDSSVIAYTEASLYAGDDIFSMKTFPARVKEDTVKLLISWSVIF